MENKINIAELLKDCPKGTKLYSPLVGECTLEHIHGELKKILISTSDGTTLTFNNNGIYFQIGNSECLLFPSKDQRDWSKFQRPFKDGDIISNGLYVAIFHKTGKPENCVKSNVVYYHCWYNKKYIYNKFKAKKDFGIGIIEEFKYATEKEKQKLFNAIKDNGYKWNAETKTLEKLVESNEDVDDKIVMSGIYFDRENYADEVELHLNNYEIEIRDGKTYAIFKNQKTETLKPKFKVGDKVVKKDGISVPILITGVGDTYYWSTTENSTEILSIAEQDDWELVPNKFDVTTLKPFDKVLVRLTKYNVWNATFFSHYDKEVNYGCYPFVTTSSKSYSICIPYEGNEHLLGTTNDCDDFYKTWE